MNEVFISYAREDRKAAEQLVAALEGAGLSVWWDFEIPTGSTFSEVIDRALSAASCVIVLWSPKSVVSNWVLEEAAEARERGILIPVITEGVTLPRGFRRYQAADLSSWDGESTVPDLEKLLADVAAMVRSAAEARQPQDASQNTDPKSLSLDRTARPDSPVEKAALGLWDRREVRVLAIYGIAGLMVNQTASALLPSLGVPDWVLNGLAWLTFGGLPVALLIAWRWPFSRRDR